MITVDTEIPVRAIRPDDLYWHFTVGLAVYPRAGFEISNGCPDDYKDILLECITRKWLKPVAYMKEDDYVCEILKS